MPAFTFEKISPPAQPGASTANDESKQPPRGAIVRVLDRLVESTVRRGTPKGEVQRRFPDRPAS